MTVLTGEKFIVETFDQFQNRLGISNSTVLQAISEGSADRWMAELNNENSDEKLTSLGYDTPVSSIEDVPDGELETVVNESVTARGAAQTIIEVLEALPENYVHLTNGTTHTIVRLTPNQEY